MPLGVVAPGGDVRLGHRPAGRRPGAHLPHHPHHQLRLRRHGQPRRRRWPPPSPWARAGLGRRRRSSASPPGVLDRCPRRAARHPPLRQRPPPRAHRRHDRPRPAARRRSPSSCPTWLDAAGVHPRRRDAADRHEFDVRPGALHRQRPAAPGRGAGRAGGARRGSCCGTEAGMAVRGMAENMDRARLLGIPVNRLSMLLWSIAGGLAALTVVLRAPNEGMPLDAAAGPTILLPALAAAVVAGMRSLSGAFVAGVLPRRARPARAVERRHAGAHLGRAAGRDRRRPAAAATRRATGPSRASRRGRWSASATGSPRPRQPARGPHRQDRAGPRRGRGRAARCPCSASDSQVNFGTVTLAYGLVAVSLVVLTGWGGVVSLGQVAIVGVGGVVTANLIADRNVDLFVAPGAVGPRRRRSSRCCWACRRCGCRASSWRSPRSPSPWRWSSTSSTRPTTSSGCRRPTSGPSCGARSS